MNLMLTRSGCRLKKHIVYEHNNQNLNVFTLTPTRFNMLFSLDDQNAIKSLGCHIFTLPKLPIKQSIIVPHKIYQRVNQRFTNEFNLNFNQVVHSQ